MISAKNHLTVTVLFIIVALTTAVQADESQEGGGQSGNGNHVVKIRFPGRRYPFKRLRVAPGRAVVSLQWCDDD